MYPLPLEICGKQWESLGQWKSVGSVGKITHFLCACPSNMPMNLNSGNYVDRESNKAALILGDKIFIFFTNDSTVLCPFVWHIEIEALCGLRLHNLLPVGETGHCHRTYKHLLVFVARFYSTQDEESYHDFSFHFSNTFDFTVAWSYRSFSWNSEKVLINTKENISYCLYRFRPPSPLWTAVCEGALQVPDIPGQSIWQVINFLQTSVSFATGTHITSISFQDYKGSEDWKTSVGCTVFAEI